MLGPETGPRESVIMERARQLQGRAPCTPAASVLDAGADLVVTVELPGASDRVDVIVEGSVLEVRDGDAVLASVALPASVAPGRPAWLRDDDVVTATLRKLH